MLLCGKIFDILLKINDSSQKQFIPRCSMSLFRLFIPSYTKNSKSMKKIKIILEFKKKRRKSIRYIWSCVVSLWWQRMYRPLLKWKYMLLHFMTNLKKKCYHSYQLYIILFFLKILLLYIKLWIQSPVFFNS